MHGYRGGQEDKDKMVSLNPNPKPYKPDEPHTQEDKDNIVAVHCKAGKGRTGLIIVCYLLFGGLCTETLDARAFYDAQRCKV